MSTSKASSKGKKPARNLSRITTQRSQNPLPPYPNNPITPPGPRPLADMPLYSPHMYHTNSMPVHFYNQQQVDPQTFYLAQAQAQTQEEFDPFLNYQQREEESSDETVPDHETQVPETQPEDETDSQPQHQPKQKQVNRRPNIQWSIEEEKLLARTWVNVSEDPIVGKDKKSDTFWRKVTTVFLQYMNQGLDYRTKDQLYTKWRNMNKLVSEFNAYHMNVTRDWPSGANNDDQLATILNTFRIEHHKTFKFVHVWLIVKDCKKWKDIGTSESHTSASKRSKTSTSTYSVSSESQGDFDLNNNPSSPRPIGRDAAKRKAKGVSSSSEGGENVGEKVEKIGAKIGTFLDIATDQEYRREKRSALRFLATDESSYHGDDLQALLEEKAEIRKKYNIGGNRA